MCQICLLIDKGVKFTKPEVDKAYKEIVTEDFETTIYAAVHYQEVIKKLEE